MKASSIRAFLNDVVSVKWYVLASACLFFAGVAFGVESRWLSDYLASQIEPLRGVVEQFEMMENTQVWMFLFIFLNNFIKSLMVVFFGAAFCVFPVYFLLMNGMVLGFVAAVAGQAGMDVASLMIRGIMPHGILEITAIIIAAAYGLKYGVLVLKAIVGKLTGRRGETGIKAFHGTLKRLIAFLFFSLLIAAFIESTITYMLVRG